MFFVWGQKLNTCSKIDNNLKIQFNFLKIKQFSIDDWCLREITVLSTSSRFIFFCSFRFIALKIHNVFPIYFVILFLFSIKRIFTFALVIFFYFFTLNYRVQWFDNITILLVLKTETPNIWWFFVQILLPIECYSKFNNGILSGCSCDVCTHQRSKRNWNSSHSYPLKLLLAAAGVAASGAGVVCYM